MINTFAPTVPFATSPFGCAVPSTQSFGHPLNGFGVSPLLFPGYGGINGHIGSAFPGHTIEVPFGINPFVASSFSGLSPWQQFGQFGARPMINSIGGVGSSFIPSTPFGSLGSAGLPISNVPFNTLSSGNVPFSPIAGLNAPFYGVSPWTSPFLGSSPTTPWTNPMSFAGVTPQAWYGWNSPVAATQGVNGTTTTTNGTSTFVGPFGVQREAA